MVESLMEVIHKINICMQLENGQDLWQSMQGTNGPIGCRIRSSVHLATWKALLILINRGEYGLFRKLTPDHCGPKATGFDVAFRNGSTSLGWLQVI